MNTTRSNNTDGPSDRHQSSSQGITLAADFLRFGPAPTPGREAVAVVATFALLAIMAFVVQPEVIVTAVAIGAVVVIFAVRAVIGTRTWAQR